MLQCLCMRISCAQQQAIKRKNENLLAEQTVFVILRFAILLQTCETDVGVVQHTTYVWLYVGDYWFLIPFLPYLWINFMRSCYQYRIIEYDLMRYICYWNEKIFCSNLCILISNFPWQFQIFHSTSWLFKPLHGSTWMKSATGIFYFHQQFWGAPQLP